MTEETYEIFVRYVLYDDDGEERLVRWLGADQDGDKWIYSVRKTRLSALEWVNRYYGDLRKAMDMAGKLAQIVHVGRRKISNGWKWDLVLIHTVVKQTTTILDKDNAMIVLALAAL